MIWITILFDLISALPSIIKLIQMLIAAIHGQTHLGDRALLIHEFESHLLNWHLDRDHIALESALKALAGRLGVVVP